MATSSTRPILASCTSKTPSPLSICTLQFGRQIMVIYERKSRQICNLRSIRYHINDHFSSRPGNLKKLRVIVHGSVMDLEGSRIGEDFSGLQTIDLV
jgi:hypothetical protein